MRSLVHCSMLMVAVAGFGPITTLAAVAKTGDSVIHNRALVLGDENKFGRGINGQSYQASALLSHAGWQYAAFYDADRRVCIARRKLPSTDWETLQLADFRYPANNTHDTISLGISKGDGRLHVSYSQHGVPLRYRVSAPGVATSPARAKWSSALFGPATDFLGEHHLSSVTYPVFLSQPDGGLLFGWRRGNSGAGENWFSSYDASTGLWSSPWALTSRVGTFVDELGTSDSRCAYLNDHAFASDGTLHITLCWREQAPTANHSLCYLASRDGGLTWQTNDGSSIPLPVHVNAPKLTVADIPRRLGLMNQCAQTVDRHGRVHVLMSQCTDESLTAQGTGERSIWGSPASRLYVHRWRSPDGTWRHSTLPGAVGSRPELVADNHSDLYALAVVPDADSPLEHGLYIQRGTLKIYRATADAEWTDWQLIHIETGPFLTEPNVDLVRWENDKVLDVLLQNSGTESSALRVLSFSAL